MKYILIITAFLAVVCLAWLEIALMIEFSQTNQSIKLAYACCIGAVGAVRFVLFLSSSYLYERKASFGWITGSMSMGATIGLYIYAENLAGLEENTRLIYHLLNSLIAGSEIASAMAISSVNRLNDLQNQMNESESKRLILKSELNSIGVVFNTKQDLSDQLSSLKANADGWLTIKDKIGIVQRKGSRYMVVSSDATIFSTDAEGNLLDAEPSQSTSTPAILNGKAIMN